MPYLLFFIVATSLFAEPSDRSVPALGYERDREGHAIPGSGTAAPLRPVQGEKVCVCQYQTNPQNCSRHQTERACHGQHDCAWLAEGRQGRATSICRNWHQEYCEREFQQRPPEGGCRRYQIIPEEAVVPNCTQDGGEYFYTFHGHGPRLEPFLSTVRQVIQGSNRTCNLSFKDQSCETFSLGLNDQPRRLPGVRDRINSELRPLLHGAQTVSITANQLRSYMTPESTSTSARNPYYTFLFDRERIRSERAVPCDADMACHERAFIRGDVYFCDSGTGMRRNVCCINSGFLGRISYSWRSDVVNCPR